MATYRVMYLCYLNFFVLKLEIIIIIIIKTEK